MTALSPMGRVPQRRPVPPRTRRRRRSAPWLALLGALALIAVVVWWRVLGHAGHNSASACGPRPSDALGAMSAASVQVRVYNATDRDGLAKTVADALKLRGFTVLTTGNDPLQDRAVTGAGEIRYGQLGGQQALLLSFQLPGVSLVPDKRTDAIVDLAVGSGYQRVAAAGEAEQARQDALARGGGC